MSSIPECLYSAGQVRELDRRAIEDHGIPGFELMQRAAGAAYGELKRRWPDAKRIHVLCGPGNNGGDGLVLAALALQEGFAVSLELLCDPVRLKGSAAEAYALFKSVGGEPVTTQAAIEADVVVDALLGTGTDRNIEGGFLDAVERMNAARHVGTTVMAIDIPSGLHADSGVMLGAVVQADVTVTFIGLKAGLMTGRGPAVTGDLRFDDLSVPADVYMNMEPQALVIQDDLRRRLLPRRPRDAHKGKYGHVLCVGGNYGFAGAIRLAGEAALRSGAGLVSVATRPETAVAMSQARPELMCKGVSSPDDLESLLSSADAILLGPGLGQDDWGMALWARVLDSKLPLVIDADGLNLLSANPGHNSNWILTPHPGEAARLLETENATIQHNRYEAVRMLAGKYGGVAILKGAGTLIASEDAPVSVCAQGNPGMAAGGMGDLLGGVIVALIAQGVCHADAARLAVYIHACAGDLAAEHGERGLLPSDLLPYIRQFANP